MLLEEWRPVIVTKHGVTYDYTGIYEICNQEGKVRALNYNKTGEVKVLKPDKDKDGYHSVTLSKNGKKRTFKVHRIVAEVFIPNPDGLPVVNHLDENPSNNSVDNLAWCTNRENIEYSQAKKVICLETGQVFDSVRKACEWAGIKGGIVECCKGKGKTAGGYHWEYV